MFYRTINEAKQNSKGNLKEVFIVKGCNYPEDKVYLNNGKLYRYEFCGNMNYVIQKERIVTIKKRKSEYGFDVSKIGMLTR